MPPTTLLTTLALPPTAALLLTTYLKNHPLPSLYTPQIHQTNTLSPSLPNSTSLALVNPKSHTHVSDTRSLTLSQSSLGKLSDEEILARFLRGFFNGWVFAAERRFIALLGLGGRKFVPVGYEGVRRDEKRIEWPSELSSATLPDVGTVMFGGNFLVLDKCIDQLVEEGSNSSSYVDIGFGDAGKGFSGCHRFEVLRAKEKGEGMEISYSCVSCNPSVDKLPFPLWVFAFHRWYALALFRDGVREVLGL